MSRAAACMWSLGCNQSNKEVDTPKVESSAVISGHLKKIGVGVWNIRWCCLEKSDLLYYTENDLKIPKGRIDMRNAQIYEEQSGSEMEFQIQTRGRVHFFSALNIHSKLQWIKALRTAAEVKESNRFDSEILVVSPKLVTRVCNVVDFNPSTGFIKIHYSGFPTMFDEWIESDSSRIVSDFGAGEVIEAEENEGVYVPVIVEKATPGGYFVKHPDQEESQAYGITKLRRAKNYETAGGTAYNIGDYPQALFWFHLHQICHYKKPYPNIDSASRSIKDLAWLKFPAFLDELFKRNTIDHLTKWQDVKKMWLNNEEEDPKRDQIILDGHLKKLGKFVWNTRWCVLEGEMLLYFMTRDSKNLKGCIHMPSSEVHERQSKTKMEFQIQTNERTHYFMARGMENKRKWLDVLLKAAKDEDEVSFLFRDNSEDPWGCEVDFQKSPESWVVEKVHEGKQAETLGVQVGDRIHSVDDQIVDEITCNTIANKLRAGHSCTISFLRTRTSAVC